MWRSLDGFAQRSQLDTWAYRVALNTALAWNRQSKRRKADVDNRHDGLAAVVGRSSDESSETRILDEFLASLSHVDRAILLLYLDNVPNDEAARILGLTEGALRVRIHRIRKRFEEDYCDKEKER